MFSANTSSADGKTYVEDVFSTYLYTGNGSTQTITNGIDLAGKGGLVWIKDRGVSNHGLFDTARGTNLVLSSNQTIASTSQANSLTAFNSNGFSIGSDTTYVNNTGASIVSWTFRKAPKFFDVVTWTGTGSSRTISHSLGSVPGCIIVKRTDTTGNWQVYHNSLTSAAYGIQLNLTNAQASDTTLWNSTAATASVFSLGTSTDVNASGGTYVAYLFAHDTTSDGLIQCGSFTTDGSQVAPFQTLGWEPQWLLMKKTNASGGWYMFDTMRGWSMSNDAFVQANTSAAEDATVNFGYPAATGFQPEGSLGTSATYIYIAIRRGPMRTPTSGASVYSAIARTGTGADTAVTGVGFAPDLVTTFDRTSGAGFARPWWDRLRGALRFVVSSGTAAEDASSTDTLKSFDMNGVSVGADTLYGAVNLSPRTYINYFLRRAPGFFDQVCYTGNGGSSTAQTLNHNLSAVPEMMVTKARVLGGGTGTWLVYHKDLGNAQALILNGTNAAGSNPFAWNSTTPTSTTFTVKDTPNNTTSATYVAYLFASCPGVSKVFSYTGNGSSQTINCGFAAGARFIMIKRTDSTGDWFVWDTARGIVSANDPHLSLNTTASEVTTDDSIDPDTSGFIVNQVAGIDINVNAATYIGLAIA